MIKTRKLKEEIKILIEFTKIRPKYFVIKKPDINLVIICIPATKTKNGWELCINTQTGARQLSTVNKTIRTNNKTSFKIKYLDETCLNALIDKIKTIMKNE